MGYLAAAQEQGSALARVRHASNEHHPCKIKGCKSTAYKTVLCKGHWYMVPLSDRIDLQIQTIRASHEIAVRGHRRMARALQRRLNDA